PTGPTGPTYYASAAHVYNLGAFAVPTAGIALPLDTNGDIVGISITHITPSTNISLEANHTYLIEYTITAIPINTKLTIYLSLNGTSIPGSGFDDVSSETTQITRTAGVIISTTGNTPSILTVNAFYAGIQFPQAANPIWPNISIRIVEIN
ncbi:hypothetical protein, partial [Streptomyces albogriseolus]